MRLGGPGTPTMRRPRGLLTPRGPVFLLVLLILTLAAMWFWGRLSDQTPSSGARDEPPVDGFARA
jgi:hypothetical protein